MRKGRRMATPNHSKESMEIRERYYHKWFLKGYSTTPKMIDRFKWFLYLFWPRNFHISELPNQWCDSPRLFSMERVFQVQKSNNMTDIGCFSSSLLLKGGFVFSKWQPSQLHHLTGLSSGGCDFIAGFYGSVATWLLVQKPFLVLRWFTEKIGWSSWRWFSFSSGGISWFPGG